MHYMRDNKPWHHELQERQHTQLYKRDNKPCNIRGNKPGIKREATNQALKERQQTTAQ
jgi:hypothetical protein